MKADEGGVFVAIVNDPVVRLSRERERERERGKKNEASAD